MYDRALLQTFLLPRKSPAGWKGLLFPPDLAQAVPQHCGEQADSTLLLRAPFCPGIKELFLEASVLSPIDR